MEELNFTSPPSRDETFLQNLTQIVLENLENEQFGVTELCHQAGYSRSQLHRKLKELKHISSSQFIREIRLKEAMKFLAKDVGTSAEISYRVGFGSPAYFNKCFHQYYGFPPGEVKKKIKDIGQQGILEPKDALKKSNSQHLLGRMRRSPKRWKQIILYLGLVITCIGCFILFTSRSSRQVSIAVLPLDNLSSDPENGYFADGVQDALIGALGRIKSIRIISRQSTLKYRNGNSDAGEIAKELGVDIIVEGSCYPYGDSTRLQLQLIKVFPQEEHLWAKEYHDEIGKILKLQSLVIKDIADEIKIKLTPKEELSLSTARIVNQATIEAYFRGMHFLSKPGLEARRKGLEFLHQAIDNDPADPLAYAGLAIGYTRVGHGFDPSLEVWKRARAAALKAIRLDSTLAEAHAALAFIKTYFEEDWIGAEIVFRKANELNANIADNHFHYAWYLVHFGRLEEALVEHKLAKDLDPSIPIYTADLGSLYWWMGKYDEAEQELDQALLMDSTFSHTWWCLGNVYLAKGLLEQAVNAHQRAVGLNPHWEWALCNTYFKVGEKQMGLELLSELRTRKVTPRLAFGFVVIYNTLGDFDEAFRWLNFQPQGAWVNALTTWPGFDSLRIDPRFNIFLQEKGLAPMINLES